MPRRWGAVMFGIVVGALVVAERLRPLRVRRDPGADRLFRNLAIGASAALISASGATAIVDPLQRWTAHRRVGLLRAAWWPPAARTLLGFLLLDYTLFLWHWLNHRSAALWRFHAVHHIDLDLDTTTGVRFHFGELALSVFLRAVQIVVIGVERQTVQLWSKLLFASVLFHHSNVAIAPAVERRLAWVIATPRMHGIHHSTRADETNTNYSSLLSWWDRLHGVFRLDVPQEGIEIGVAGMKRPFGIVRSLGLPFTTPLPAPAQAKVGKRAT